MIGPVKNVFQISFTDFYISEVLVSFSPFSFSAKCPFWFWVGFFERLRGRPPKAKRAIFPRKGSSRNDTKTPGTGKSLLSPRESELEKRWTFSPFWTKMVRTKIKPEIKWQFFKNLLFQPIAYMVEMKEQLNVTDMKGNKIGVMNIEVKSF